MKVLSGGWEHRAGHVLRVWVDIPPKRNGEPNAVAAMQALRLASHVNPDAFDPVETAAPVVVSHAMAAAMLRDQVPPEDDEGEPYPIPGCATGTCSGE